MDDSISVEMEKRIRELCDEIASAEGLDSELHDELYGHIEDKVLGYLSGEEVLSEADAFLLAREHFGDGVVVRGELEDVHSVVMKTSFYRRFVLAVNVHLGAYFLFGVFQSLFVLLLAWTGLGSVVFGVLLFVSTPLFFAFEIKVLRSWKLKEAAGESIWYRTWSTNKLITLLCSLIVAIVAKGFVHFTLFMVILSHTGREQDVVFLRYYNDGAFGIFTMLFFVVAPLVAWLVWFDVQPRIRGGLFRIVILYTLMQGLTSLVYTPFFVSHIPTAGIRGTDLLQYGALAVVLESPVALLAGSFQAVSIVILPALITWLFYEIWSEGNYRSNIQIAKA